MTVVQKTCQTCPYVKNMFVYLHHMVYIELVASRNRSSLQKSRGTPLVNRKQHVFFQMRIAVRHCTQQRLQFCCSWNTSAFATVYIIYNTIYILKATFFVFTCLNTHLRFGQGLCLCERVWRRAFCKSRVDYFKWFPKGCKCQQMSSLRFSCLQPAASSVSSLVFSTLTLFQLRCILLSLGSSCPLWFFRDAALQDSNFNWEQCLPQS